MNRPASLSRRRPSQPFLDSFLASTVFPFPLANPFSASLFFFCFLLLCFVRFLASSLPHSAFLFNAPCVRPCRLRILFLIFVFVRRVVSVFARTHERWQTRRAVATTTRSGVSDKIRVSTIVKRAATPNHPPSSYHPLRR